MKMRADFHTNIAVVLLLYVSLVQPGKVLFLAVPWYSQINSYTVMAEALSREHGHNSTLVTTQAIADKLKKDHFLNIIVTDSFEQKNFEKKRALLLQDICTTKDFNYFFDKLYTDEIETFCSTIRADENLFETLKEESFDVAVVADLYCLNIFAHNLSLPRIYAAVPFDFIKWRIAFMPSITKSNLNDYPITMSFFERFSNTLMAITLVFEIHFSALLDNTLTYAPGVSYKNVEELDASYQFILMDIDPVLDFPPPMMAHSAQVGGVSVRNPKPLSGQLKSFMDKSEDGVIIVSFGSSPIHLPFDKINVLFDAFKKMPALKFVFRYGNKTTFDKNIMMLPWLPQNDLLAHHNTKAFITHCGNSGQYESLYNAVPMIGLPLYYDQYHNAQRMRAKGYGIVLDFCNIQVDTLVDAVSEILKDEYKYAILNASRIFHSQPMSADDRAAFWIDHVIQYGDYLQPHSLPFYQYYMLDILACSMCMTVVFLALSIKVCIKCYRLCVRMKIKQE